MAPKGLLISASGKPKLPDAPTEIGNIVVDVAYRGLILVSYNRQVL